MNQIVCQTSSIHPGTNEIILLQLQMGLSHVAEVDNKNHPKVNLSPLVAIAAINSRQFEPCEEWAVSSIMLNICMEMDGGFNNGKLPLTKQLMKSKK